MLQPARRVCKRAAETERVPEVLRFFQTREAEGLQRLFGQGEEGCFEQACQVQLVFRQDEKAQPRQHVFGLQGGGEVELVDILARHFSLGEGGEQGLHQMRALR